MKNENESVNVPLAAAEFGVNEKTGDRVVQVHFGPVTLSMNQYVLLMQGLSSEQEVRLSLGGSR